jgi:hypothetical protein
MMAMCTVASTERPTRSVKETDCTSPNFHPKTVIVPNTQMTTHAMEATDMSAITMFIVEKRRTANARESEIKIPINATSARRLSVKYLINHAQKTCHIV